MFAIAAIAATAAFLINGSVPTSALPSKIPEIDDDNWEVVEVVSNSHPIPTKPAKFSGLYSDAKIEIIEGVILPNTSIPAKSSGLYSDATIEIVESQF